MRNELIPPLLGYYTMAGGGAAVVPPVIYDTFTDTNATAIASHTPEYYPVGSAWSNLLSEGSIVNNRLQFAADGAAIINSGISDYTITENVTVYTLATTHVRLSKVIFRHNLANGTNWQLYVVANNLRLSNDGGSSYEAQTDITAAGLTNLDVIELKIVCNGTSIKGYLNGAYEVAVTDATYQTDTYVGASCYRNTTSTYYVDEFKVVA